VVDNLAERLYRDSAAALELYAIYLGERLGLYRALADGGPATPAELATRTGTAERYMREWLEHHAASGLVEVESPGTDERSRRYRLPAEHARILAEPDAIDYGGHIAAEIVRAGRRMADLVEAYRTGGAPPPLAWAPEGRQSPNRARFLNLLGKEWLPAIPDINARLRAEPPARVADIACGTGWSSIAMALAYPGITVHGIDLDPDAITAARLNAEEFGVADRVTFSVTDAAQLGGSAGYDLVTIIEALHDMTNPVAALVAARELLADGGNVLVVDVKVAEEFTAPAPLRDQYEYGWSLVACLPDAMGDPGSVATGTVMRPETLRRYAVGAGFAGIEVLPIDTEYWRFYRLVGVRPGRSRSSSR
jgi:SAM-dependent methyltransferase